MTRMLALALAFSFAACIANADDDAKKPAGDGKGAFGKGAFGKGGFKGNCNPEDFKKKLEDPEFRKMIEEKFGGEKGEELKKKLMEKFGGEKGEELKKKLMEKFGGANGEELKKKIEAFKRKK